ncbi:MAG: aromatic ring-hydroxylating dioxygenase subunit alpha [Gammaproteobacteria bacterium]
MDLLKGSHVPLLRHCWYVAAWSHEVPVGKLHGLTIIGQPVLIYRKHDGRLAAMADQCCHRHAPLSRGRLEGDDVRCLYHGLKYDSTGRCIEIPGQDDIPERFCVRTYEVQEADGWIWVWMGEQASADHALIPSTTGPDDPRYHMRSGHLDYQANYLLVNDNLTDFSHIAFVHENSFARGTKDTAVLQPRVQLLERGIRISRWNRNQPSRHNDPQRPYSDVFMTYDFLVPGVLMMFTGSYPPGTAEAVQLGTPGEREPFAATFTSQAVTPLTANTSRYFFCWGPRSEEHAANPQIIENLWQLAHQAFEEDRVMIEAQQRNIDLHTNAPVLSISHDRGPTLMRKVIERLHAAETGVDPHFIK